MSTLHRGVTTSYQGVSDLHVSGMSFSSIFILLCKVGNVLENRDFEV